MVQWCSLKINCDSAAAFMSHRIMGSGNPRVASHNSWIAGCTFVHKVIILLSIVLPYLAQGKIDSSSLLETKVSSQFSFYALITSFYTTCAIYWNISIYLYFKQLLIQNRIFENIDNQIFLSGIGEIFNFQ